MGNGMMEGIISVLRICFVVLNHIYCIPAHFVWLHILLPLRVLNPSLFWKIEGVLYHWVCSLVSLWSWWAYEIYELGDDLKECLNGRTLVLVNHRSTADVLLLMRYFDNKPAVLNRIVWVMSKNFKYTSFGMVSNFHDDFFLGPGPKMLESLKSHLSEVYLARDRKFIVLFPEGGILDKHREASARFADQRGLPVLNQVNWPRIGAYNAILQGGDLQWILDVTIIYPEVVPLAGLEVLTKSRKPCDVQFLFRLYPASESRESPEKWLYDRWQEKDTILENYYKNGTITVDEFDPNSLRPKIVNHAALRFCLIHLFFIISSYIQYNLIKTLITDAYAIISKLVIW